MPYEPTEQDMLVHDACMELEHGASLEECEELARKYPGRWWNGQDGTKAKAKPEVKPNGRT